MNVKYNVSFVTKPSKHQWYVHKVVIILWISLISFKVVIISNENYHKMLDPPKLHVAFRDQFPILRQMQFIKSPTRCWLVYLDTFNQLKQLEVLYHQVNNAFRKLNRLIRICSPYTLHATIPIWWFILKAKNPHKYRFQFYNVITKGYFHTYRFQN